MNTKQLIVDGKFHDVLPCRVRDVLPCSKGGIDSASVYFSIYQQLSSVDRTGWLVSPRLLTSFCADSRFLRISLSLANCSFAMMACQGRERSTTWREWELAIDTARCPEVFLLTSPVEKILQPVRAHFEAVSASCACRGPRMLRPPAFSGRCL